MEVSPQTSASGTSKTPQQHWFVAEIQQMMYGLGDCRKPLQKSAALIEDIVLQQMTVLLYKAEEVARMRNAKGVGVEDFMFLLRNNKVKLRRLIRYMKIRDLKGAATKGTQVEGEETGEDDLKPQPKKRRKVCTDFLTTIDQTGELLALLEDDSIDEVKHERALRAELCAQTLNAQKYLEFTEARQASFTPKFKAQKFHDWLMSTVNLELKANAFAIEIISYLAYETVAQIVDLALLLRRDAAARADDPFSAVMAPVCISHEVPVAVPSQPQPSPAVSAVTASPLTQASPVGATTESGSSDKLNPRKKRMESSVTSKDEVNVNPLTPEEIRHAVQRYTMVGGPFADFMKDPTLPAKRVLLCT